MGRAAELLRPSVVIIENVPAIRNDKADVLSQTAAGLRRSDYVVAERVIDLTTVGVPQRRRRHVLIALKTEIAVDPRELLDQVATTCLAHPTRSVRWAIEDLVGAEGEGFDSPARMSADNAARIAWLHEHDEYNLPNERRPRCHQDEHTYLSMYGRLRWDEPAQTITTGYGSMGQGRFVHPARHRTLTPHEAARLQTFPDFFSFETTSQRGAWARMIGNAVPPFLGRALAQVTLPALTVESPIAATGAR
jgi:DNA (cytosine-5)-methyltransferase 1